MSLSCFRVRFSFFASFAFTSLLMAGCSGGGSGSAVTLSGVAATGAALTGATVTAKCSLGSPETSLTDAEGKYSLISSGVLPCLVRAQSGNTVLHSVATGSGSAASANISPLTEAVVNQLTDDPVAFFANFDKSSAAKMTDSAVANAQKAVIANLVSNGLTVPTTLTDFIKAPLVAVQGSTSGNDYDKLLDSMATQLYQLRSSP